MIASGEHGFPVGTSSGLPSRCNPGGGDARKSNDQPHAPLLAMNLALRCRARTRSGELCQSPAVNGKRRCRMHGGASGSGAPSGNKNAWLIAQLRAPPAPA
jgi:hypothetical protein